MQVLHQLADWRDDGRPLALAVGTFDGFHRGHQAVVARALAEASARQGRGWVMTFEPHPMKVLHPARAPALLTALRHKLALLEGAGVEGVLVLPFTHELAGLEPADFIGQLVRAVPSLRAMVVGANWTFGHRARGNPRLLEELAGAAHLSVAVVPALAWQGAPISSTRVRRAVEAGRLADAEAMLGRPFGLLGRVVSGRQFGRTLGFPTANIRPENEVTPPPGVYAAELAVGDRRLPGAAFRPQDGAPGGVILEIHLLDFTENLYGQDAELRLLETVREVRRFERPAELQAQIARDVEGIRQFFRDRPRR